MDKPDIFDRLMTLPLLKPLEPFYHRNKEMLLYLFFGVGTFVVSIVSYAWLDLDLGMNELVANVFAWVLAVLFAFFTNRIWVFDAPTETMGAFMHQILSFFGGRGVTLVVEEVILAVFITYMGFPSLPVKVAAQIIVITLNYIISKLIVFRHAEP